jgi:hypothetical protein
MPTLRRRLFPGHLVNLGPGVEVAVPSLADLAATKQFAAPDGHQGFAPHSSTCGPTRSETLTLRWDDVHAEDRRALAAEANRQLSPEEWAAYVNQPLSAEERQNIEELLDWFARKYPTPAARLAYARRAYRRWVRNLAASSPPPAI